MAIIKNGRITGCELMTNRFRAKGEKVMSKTEKESDKKEIPDWEQMRVLCPVHAPAPDPRLAKMPEVFFVGKLVKKRFISTIGRGEHMWISVDHAENGMLFGTLDNHPLQPMNMKYGDGVSVRLTEIEDVADVK